MLSYFFFLLFKNNPKSKVRNFPVFDLNFFENYAHIHHSLHNNKINYYYKKVFELKDLIKSTVTTFSIELINNCIHTILQLS